MWRIVGNDKVTGELVEVATAAFTRRRDLVVAPGGTGPGDGVNSIAKPAKEGFRSTTPLRRDIFSVEIGGFPEMAQ
jgi:hypothetical protein